MVNKSFVIAGAGPSGLSLGYWFQQKKFNDFSIFENNTCIGGLSTSFKDKKGFIWDMGGHVIHSKNKEFVTFVKKILKNNLVVQNRKAFIYFKDKLIPYPFQNNIAFLPDKEKTECLHDLIEQQSKVNNGTMEQWNNFFSWILNNFGQGIAKHFMLPQNKKSWQYPLDKIGINWLNNKVSIPPLREIKKQCQGKDPQELSWGSHQKFLYPKTGGITSLWQNTADLLKNHLRLNTEIVKINLCDKTIIIKQGSSPTKKIFFDKFISTMPLNKLITISNAPKKIKLLAKQLEYNSGLIIGLGFNKKPIINDWHWIYFPHPQFSFFRVCHMSNFGGQITPSLLYSSILVEISWRNTKPNLKKLIDAVIRQIGSVFFTDKNIIPISIFTLNIPYFYPIPTVNRDIILNEVNSYLQKHQVYSIGRFGSWQYENGNMDNCFEKAKDLAKFLLN